jgi:hypothetical protein
VVAEPTLDLDRMVPTRESWSGAGVTDGEPGLDLGLRGDVENVVARSSTGGVDRLVKGREDSRRILAGEGSTPVGSSAL